MKNSIQKKFFKWLYVIPILLLPTIQSAANVTGSSLKSFFQQQDLQKDITVTGKVLSELNEPLPGANVIIKGTASGTITNADGNYSLVVPENSTLVFSYVGYINQEVLVGDQTLIDITMQPDLEQLEELVVVGYGSQKKSHLTGAVSKVTNENLDQIAVARVDEALVGQVSGVNIQATDGEAGAPPTIRIRGTGSVTGSSNPLIVVDGLVVDNDFLSNLDMNNIESFEVLKDAASAAIYGSRGGNGIIMVTTKSGRPGKTRFSYNGFFGQKEARQSDAYYSSLAETAAAELAFNGFLSDRTLVKQQLGVDRDWQDVIFDGGNIMSHSLSARGGTEKTTFNVSGSYLKDEGVMLTDEFERYSLSLKVNTKVSDKFTLGVSVAPSYTDRRRFDGSTHDILRQTPWLPLYLDENTIQFVNRLRDGGKYADAQIGDYALQRMFDDWDLVEGQAVASGGTDISNTSNTNPAAKVIERERLDKKFKLFGTIYGQYEIIDGLSFKSAFSGSTQSTRRSRWQGVEAHRNGAANTRLDDNNEEAIHLVWENFLTYNKVSGKHEFNAVLGTSTERWRNYASTVVGTGYDSDLVKSISNATTIARATSFEWEKRLLSFFGRVNYAYNDKFLASVSLRRDGSSIFGADNKYGNFPAVSVGWNISNEDFLMDNKAINLLKLRVSYGATGNDRLNTGNYNVNVTSNLGGATSLSSGDVLIDNYPYLALLGAGTAVISGAAAASFNPINIANPDLKWERSVEINPGVDFILFNNVLSGSIDYYKRTSDQLLLFNPISGTTGFGNALVNLGEVENKGFEIELRSNNINRENFTWSTTVIGSRNKNELTDFADSNGQIQSVDAKRAAEWINLEGLPISSYYGWVVDRDIPLEYIKNPFHPVGAEAQDVYVKDLNGDGIINDEDKTVLGNPYPDFIWSVSNNFTFGNIDLGFMFQGSHGAEIRNMGDQYLFNHFNSSQDFDPDITPDQEFIKQKIFTDDIIQDASYIALRTINIGYTFSAGLLENIGISRARVYAAGQNLLYLTADGYTGFNPESIDNTSPTTWGYQRAGSPIQKTVTIGFNLDF